MPFKTELDPVRRKIDVRNIVITAVKATMRYPNLEWQAYARANGVTEDEFMAAASDPETKELIDKMRVAPIELSLKFTESLEGILVEGGEALLESVRSGTMKHKDLLAALRYASEVHPSHEFTKVDRKEIKQQTEHVFSGDDIARIEGKVAQDRFERERALLGSCKEAITVTADNTVNEEEFDEHE